MGLTQEEIDASLKKIQDDFAAVWAKGDPAKFAELYHPEAVLVHVGHKSIYGREAIVELFREFMATPSEFTTVVDVNLEAGNGLYFIQKGRFVLTQPNGEKAEHPYEQIFKRQDDGSYVIYHDEFNL